MARDEVCTRDAKGERARCTSTYSENMGDERYRACNSRNVRTEGCEGGREARVNAEDEEEKDGREGTGMCTVTDIGPNIDTEHFGKSNTHECAYLCNVQQVA